MIRKGMSRQGLGMIVRTGSYFEVRPWTRSARRLRFLHKASYMDVGFHYVVTIKEIKK